MQSRFHSRGHGQSPKLPWSQIHKTYFWVGAVHPCSPGGGFPGANEGGRPRVCVGGPRGELVARRGLIYKVLLVQGCSRGQVFLPPITASYKFKIWGIWFWHSNWWLKYVYPNYLLIGAQKGQKIAVSPIDEVGFSSLTEAQICQKLFSFLNLSIQRSEDQSNGKFFHCYSTLKSKSCIETILNRGRNLNLNGKHGFRLLFWFF